jgi:NDP-sugar pyrophosphorylase family protein
MITILPAAGTASRVSGIPKFMLPVVDLNSSTGPIPLINWHLMNLSKLQTKVVIPTSRTYLEIIKVMTKEFEPMVIEINSKSMADSVVQASNHIIGNEYLVIMPDTFFSNYDFAHLLLQAKGSITLATWKYNEGQHGKFGSVELSKSTMEVVKVIDKDINCPLKEFWGSLAMSRDFLQFIDKEDSHLGESFNRYLSSGQKINYIEAQGRYFDIGTFDEYFRF